MSKELSSAWRRKIVMEVSTRTRKQKEVLLHDRNFVPPRHMDTHILHILERFIRHKSRSSYWMH